MKSHTKIFLFTILDMCNYSVNTFCPIFNKVNRYFAELNGKKYLMLVPTN